MLLKHENIANEFNAKFNENYDKMVKESTTNDNTPINLQAKYNAFVNSLSKTGQETLPKMPRIQTTSIVSPQSEIIRHQRNQAKQTCAKNNTIENKNALTTLNKNLRLSYRQDKTRDLEKDLLSLKHADQMGDSRTTWGIVSKLSEKNHLAAELGTMSKPDGSSITPTKETHEWFLYFQDLLGGENFIASDLDLPTPETTTLPINTSPFTSEEIKKAIKQAKSGKAPGIDEVTVEALKHGGTEITTALLDICNQAFTLKCSPHQWRESILKPIFKKGSKKADEQLRGISLMSVAAKLFNRMLLNRIRPVIDPKLRDNQAGFRPDRSCTDQIHILRRIIEGAETHNLPLVITYIDFKKAFDSIDRKMLFAILRHYGIPEHSSSGQVHL